MLDMISQTRVGPAKAAPTAACQALRLNEGRAGGSRGDMMQIKPAPQQLSTHSARAAPAEAQRASPVLQKNIVMPQAASAKIVQPPPAAQQQSAPTSEASLNALADRLTNLAVSGDGRAAAHTAQPFLGGIALDDHGFPRGRAAPRGGDVAAPELAPGSHLQVKAAQLAAREQARAEAVTAKKHRRAEKAQAKRDAAAMAAAALATRLASIRPAEASSRSLAEHTACLTMHMNPLR